MANIFQEQDGSTSSRRVASFLFPALLYVLGAGIAVLSVVFKTEVWGIVAGCGVIALGVVLQLFLFNFINITNVQEIVAGIKKE
jgi:membrane protein YdbS with pleckstrin-like domain